MAAFKTKPALGAAMAVTSLLALAACSDPGATAASAPSSGASTSSGATGFNLAPEQNRVKVTVDAAAAALVPDAIKADGKLTVVSTGGTPPLSLFATDNKTLIGSEVDIAYAVGESLGLEVEVLPVAWADWPLGIESAKYEAVLSNVTVTEARKEKFDFATYRNDLLGFYAKTDSTIGDIKEAKDVAGKRVIVGSGTNQEAILVRWDDENKAKGLAPVEFQYYDDDSASTLALQLRQDPGPLGAVFGSHPEVRTEPGRPAQEVGGPADEWIPVLQQRCGDPPLTTCSGVSTLGQLSLAVDRGGSSGRQFQKQQ